MNTLWRRFLHPKRFGDCHTASEKAECFQGSFLRRNGGGLKMFAIPGDVQTWYTAISCTFDSLECFIYILNEWGHEPLPFLRTFISYHTVSHGQHGFLLKNSAPSEDSMHDLRRFPKTIKAHGAKVEDITINLASYAQTLPLNVCCIFQGAVAVMFDYIEPQWILVRFRPRCLVPLIQVINDKHESRYLGSEIYKWSLHFEIDGNTSHSRASTPERTRT